MDTMEHIKCESLNMTCNINLYSSKPKLRTKPHYVKDIIYVTYTHTHTNYTPNYRLIYDKTSVKPNERNGTFHNLGPFCVSVVKL